MTKYSNLALFDYNLPSLITESCLLLHTSLYTHCTLHYTHHLIKIVKQLGVCFSIIDNILAKRYVDRKLCPPSISSRCYDAKVSRATTAFPNQFLYPHLIIGLLHHNYISKHTQQITKKLNYLLWSTDSRVKDI